MMTEKIKRMIEERGYEYTCETQLFAVPNQKATEITLFDPATHFGYRQYIPEDYAPYFELIMMDAIYAMDKHCK